MIAPDLPTAALEYAERGWPVIPLHSPAARGCTCGQADCANPGKHPRTAHGLKDASSDPTKIREWWRRWPDANIGIATGQPSGVFVVDVDGEAGRVSVAEIERQGLTFPHTLTVITGRADGGTHFYYRMPSGVDIRNDQSGRIGPHIDARGTGGFVVAAGSTHASGQVYHFVEPSAIIADTPGWAIERLTARQAMPTATAQASPQTVKKGSRTNALVSAAGTMRRQGMGAEAISAALAVKNRAKCSPPLPESKVRYIAADIAKRYPAGGPDILESAMEVIESGTYRSHTDRFGALCAVLQRLRGHEPVILPVERIAHAFACHWTLIARLRRQAVVEGWLIPERRAIAHRQAASFWVLSETVEPGMYHENEKETVEEQDKQHSDTSLSNTGDCPSETPGFSQTCTLPLDASIFSLEQVPSEKDEVRI